MSLGLKLKRVVKRKCHWYTVTVALAMVYVIVMVYHSIGERFKSSLKDAPEKMYHKDFYWTNMKDLSETRMPMFENFKRSLHARGDRFTGTSSSKQILQQKENGINEKKWKEMDKDKGNTLTDFLISTRKDGIKSATTRAGFSDSTQIGYVRTDEPIPPPIPFTAEPVDSEEKISSCPDHKIARKHPIPKDRKEKIACKPHVAPLKACQYTEKAYKIDEKLHTCRDNNNEIYCKIYSELGEIKFVCNNKHKCDLYTIYGFDLRNGGERILDKAQNVSYLESLMVKYAQKMINQNIHFLFIECIREPNYPSRTQLIILPARPKKLKQMRGYKPNINIVLLDSLSRAHFYRSLPVAVEMFNDINKGIASNSNAEIIDFESFQSVHGHSAENFHALFTGKLLPKHLTDRQKEGANVGIAELYGILKDQGYETMYQDDLCWMYWWGVRMELGMVSSWNELKKAIPKANIAHTGLTFSSCQVLSKNNLHTPFQGPEDNQICFNGRFQHSYLLQHIYEFHKARTGYKTRPRISFTTINTPHDYKGLRVQTLNQDLAKFIKDTSELQNTLTIILADHGNTYTQYTSTMLEGRFEMHHPSFFMVVPQGVANWLGEEAMNNLRINSNRLFTMVDLHKTIKAIGKRGADGSFPGSKGLLGVIPANRQCKDLKLALPNLCVCEGWDSPARNDTSQMGILEFAVGKLNNRIELQRARSWKTKPSDNHKRHCHRLFPVSFRNVRERNDGDDLITTMDFAVRSGHGSDQVEEVFHVEVQSTISPSEPWRNMKLLSYDRISQYGIYRKCKDETVDVKLCVCSFRDNITIDPQGLWKATGFDFTNLMLLQPRYQEISGRFNLEGSIHEKCIYMISRNYQLTEDSGKSKNIYAAAVELINICPRSDFEVLISIASRNVKTSREFPAMVPIKAQRIKFVGVIMRDVSYWDSYYSIGIIVNKRNI